MTGMEELPFTLINELERKIAADPQFRQGIEYGRPRPGHPEGNVKHHIAEVLNNVQRWYAPSPYYPSLRLVALIHDTFKFEVDHAKPRSGPNHHGAYARRFAESYLDDEAVLDVIQWHDEAHNAWAAGERSGDWNRAVDRAQQLIECLANNLAFYRAFYRCDNATGDKSQDGRIWFESLVDTMTGEETTDT